MTDIDLDALVKRIERLEEFVGIVKQHGYPIPGTIPPSIKDIQKVWDDITNPAYIVGKIPCMFDSLSPEDRMKPMGLSCGCPKCSPYCVSLSDVLSQQRVSAVELFKDLVPKGEAVEVGVHSCGKLVDCVSDKYLEDK